MGDDEKTPLKLDFDPKFAWSFAVLPSPQTQDCWRAESLMTP